MLDNKLDCCIVRDLLPSYLEDLTEADTSAMVKAHLEGCDSCRQLEIDMRTQIPVEKAPGRALKFLKRVKRTRLTAAILTIIITLFCMWWLYDQAFHYANTEAGWLAAVYDYVPTPSKSTHLRRGVAEGTPLRVIARETTGKHMFVFFAADTEGHVHGFMHLVRGINGKYRPIEASYKTSKYRTGIYGLSLTPKGMDQQLFLLGGDSCREIYSAEVRFSYIGSNPSKTYRDYPTKKYYLPDTDFLWVMDQQELEKELGLSDKDISWLYIQRVSLLGKNGDDLTLDYLDFSMRDSWSSSKTTDEAFMLYVYMGITAALGLVLVRYFLRRD